MNETFCIVKRQFYFCNNLISPESPQNVCSFSFTVLLLIFSMNQKTEIIKSEFVQTRPTHVVKRDKEKEKENENPYFIVRNANQRNTPKIYFAQLIVGPACFNPDQCIFCFTHNYCGNSADSICCKNTKSFLQCGKEAKAVISSPTKI